MPANGPRSRTFEHDKLAANDRNSNADSISLAIAWRAQRTLARAPLGASPELEAPIAPIAHTKSDLPKPAMLRVARILRARAPTLHHGSNPAPLVLARRSGAGRHSGATQAMWLARCWGAARTSGSSAPQAPLGPLGRSRPAPDDARAPRRHWETRRRIGARRARLRLCASG